MHLTKYRAMTKNNRLLFALLTPLLYLSVGNGYAIDMSGNATSAQTRFVADKVADMTANVTLLQNLVNAYKGCNNNGMFFSKSLYNAGESGCYNPIIVQEDVIVASPTIISGDPNFVTTLPDYTTTLAPTAKVGKVDFTFGDATLSNTFNLSFSANSNYNNTVNLNYTNTTNGVPQMVGMSTNVAYNSTTRQVSISGGNRTFSAGNPSTYTPMFYDNVVVKNTIDKVVIPPEVLQ